MAYNWKAEFEVRDTRNGEWYWVQKEVLASKVINASDKLVYSCLAYFSNQKTQQAYPSYDTIAELVNLSRNTVIKSIKALIESNFISRKTREGKVNYYALLKVTSPNSAPLPNESLDQCKLDTTPVQIRATNKNYLTRYNNKNIIDKSIMSEELTQGKDFGNLEVNRILEEFSQVTGLTKPSDQKPRQWAGNFARSKDKGVEMFRPCLEYLVNDLKFNITKLETVFRQFSTYERDVLTRVRPGRKLTNEEEAMRGVI